MPGLLHPLQLLVAQRPVLGAEGVVVAGHDELAVQALGGLDFGLIGPGIDHTP
jgi:hypothetical protein